MPASSPVRKLLADRAYDSLKSSLQSGDYPPGSFLSERRLASSLGMSKTPIKEALVRLESEGFLSISPQQGIVVREPSIREVLDLFDLREALETYVVRRIAGRLEPDQVARLKRNLKGQAQACRERNLPAATQLDTEFHAMICEFFGNRELSQTLWRMRERLNRLFLSNMARYPGRLEPSTREHAAIAAAVLRGQGERAAELVRQHLETGRRLILQR